jgi:release factor glutamine methyltransferase
VRLRTLVARRVAGEPLEYVLGFVDFAGLRLRVADGVFVPRQRTVFLVTTAASLLHPGDVVVDLCCGVGAIGAALLQRVGALDLVAADIDPDAVEVARENLGDHASVVLGDLYDPLPDRLRGRVDVIAVNAPYVPTDAIALMPPEARSHEHHVALDGGADGLDLHRRIAASATEWLRPGGSVVIEVSDGQADASVAVFGAAGLEARIASDDDADATCVVAVRTGLPAVPA